MTEDQQHKENFIQISKNILNKDNRYKDILPCKNIFNFIY